MLVAVSIPIFTSQLEKSKEATDAANIRSAYAECSTAVLSGSNDTTNGVTYTPGSGDTPAQASKDVAIKQGVSGWVSSGEIAGKEFGPSKTGIPSVANGNTVTVTCKADGTWTCELKS